MEKKNSFGPLAVWFHLAHCFAMAGAVQKKADLVNSTVMGLINSCVLVAHDAGKRVKLVMFDDAHLLGLKTLYWVLQRNMSLLGLFNSADWPCYTQLKFLQNHDAGLDPVFALRGRLVEMWEKLGHCPAKVGGNKTETDLKPEDDLTRTLEHAEKDLRQYWELVVKRLPKSNSAAVAQCVSEYSHYCAKQTASIPLETKTLELLVTGHANAKEVLEGKEPWVRKVSHAVHALTWFVNHQRGVAVGKFQLDWASCSWARLLNHLPSVEVLDAAIRLHSTENDEETLSDSQVVHGVQLIVERELSHVWFAFRVSGVAMQDVVLPWVRHSLWSTLWDVELIHFVAVPKLMGGFFKVSCLFIHA